MNYSDLDLFILALVQLGLATPYDLKVKAGLSVGSTAPVLERLEKEHLLTATEPGTRKSRRFTATVNGKKALQSGWQGLLERQPGDFDSILRVAFIGWLFGRRDTVTKYLEKSTSALRNAAATRAAEAKQLQALIDGEPSGEAFRWFRTLSSAATLSAEADVLKKIAGEITSTKRTR